MSRVIGALVLLAALGACGYAGSDEIDAESAAILARAPVGSSFKAAPGALAALGFSCHARDSGKHLVCERETPEWLICTRRTRAILIQQDGRLANVLVNVGHFCT